jgi:hypothetical protein
MEPSVEPEYSIFDVFASEKFDVPLEGTEGSLNFRYEKFPLLADGVTYFDLRQTDEDGVSRQHRASIENPAYIETVEVVGADADVPAETVESWVPDEVDMEGMDYWRNNPRRPDTEQERIDRSIEQAEEVFDQPVFMSRQLYGMSSRDDKGSLYGRPVYMSGIQETEAGDVHVLQGRPYGDSRDIEGRLHELLEFTGADIPELRETVERVSDKDRRILDDA